MKATEAKKELKCLASTEVASVSMGFFKSGPGEYAEGDVFIGVRVPMIRNVARRFKQLPLSEIELLLQSTIHEERLLALLIVVQNAMKGDDAYRKAVYELYCRNIRHVNNWDLVDTSAPVVVGGYLRDKSRQPLVKFAKSSNLWERRIAIIATQHFIRLGEFEDTLKISKILLADGEDLLHKATGWMLREVGKRDETLLIAFLDEHGSCIPRTMLRYAIERLSPEVRNAYLRSTRS
jgi:3-methyladenine DNA glycosylase AlkD